MLAKSSNQLRYFMLNLIFWRNDRVTPTKPLCTSASSKYLLIHVIKALLSSKFVSKFEMYVTEAGGASIWGCSSGRLMVSSWRTLLIPSSSVAIFVISQDAFQGEVDFRFVGFKYYPTLQSFTTSASHATHKRTVIIPSMGGWDVLRLVILIPCPIIRLLPDKVLNWDTGPSGSHDIVPSGEGVTEKAINMGL